MATRTSKRPMVSNEEYERAKGIVLMCARNIVEDLSKPDDRMDGTDIDDALKSGKELTHQLAIVRRWWNDRQPKRPAW